MMKKWLTAALCAMLLSCVFLVPASAAQSELMDTAEYLTVQESYDLSEAMFAVADEYDINVIIYTTDDLDGRSAEAIATEIYESDRGYGEDAILLVLGSKAGENHILTNGICTDALDDDHFDDMIDDILWEQSFQDYNAACEAFVSHTDDAMSDYLYGESVSPFTILLVAIGGGLLIGFIVVSVMKGKLKSVRMQVAANDYVRRNSLNLTRQNDLFLYSTTTRVAKPKNNSGSSGGRSGGGGRGGRSF